jgi:cell division protein FtsB
MKTIEELEAQLETVTRERDEARAEVERLRDENAHRREMLRRETEANERLRKENDAIAAEVERLRREVDAMAAELHALSVKYDARDNESANAYRRGAEAMRDECIGAACGFFMGTTGFCNGDEDELEAVLEALPIPEEP